MAFVIGDGDNTSYIKGSRKNWFDSRTAYCMEQQAAGKECFPLLWTMSPQLLHLAPEMISWYYNESYKTKADTFVLPPSGDLYSYPGTMQENEQLNHARSTERDCELMSTAATVHWEWFYQWNQAISTYFPKFSSKNIVKAFFGVAVPYLIPIIPCDTYFCIHKNLFTIINDNTILFRPREWRGTDESKAPPLAGKDYLTPEKFAEEINGYKRGSVGYVYLTSDGGFTIQNLYDMVAQLDDHVEVVNYNTLVEMALASHKAGLGDEEEERSVEEFLV